MIIDGHVKFRFVQRIMGIKDEWEVNRFIANNEYEVIYKILEFVNHAELLIENYAPARRDTLDYYINNETLIVMKSDKRELVTLFDITLDTNNKENTEKIKQYVKTIKKNNGQIKAFKERQKKPNQIAKHYEFMIDYLGGGIDELLIKRIQLDAQESINICKELATQEKELRLENRELMSEMFKKLDVN